MKFLLVVLVIRCVVVLLEKMNREEQVNESSERKNFIHPSEFKTRW